jgi:hypothetical protein
MRFRIYTEDGGSFAEQTVQLLMRRVIAFAYPDLDTSKIVWLPRQLGSKISSGNRWKSSRPTDQKAKTELVREIANEANIDDQFVLFHFDGDAAWSLRQQQQRDTVAQFETEIAAKVKRTVEQRNRVFDSNKIIRLIPYYAIESWLFQNTEECAMQGGDQSVLNTWREDPSLLDELIRPHESMSFGKNRNKVLAESTTKEHIRKNDAVEKSLHALIETLQKNQLLQIAATKISK